MPSMGRLVPNYLLERSLTFKTTVIIVGALLLLLSTFIRESHPIIWILPFLGGALIEWLIVATVYTEMSKIEEEIEGTRDEIQETQSEIETTIREIEETKGEIKDAKRNIFSFISDSQGVGVTNTIEDRISELEDEVGIGSFSRESLPDRVASLERSVEKIERDQNRRW